MIISYEDYPVTPWRNGQGVTRDIFMSGSAGVDKSSNFEWRLSLADVEQPGAFSIFDGYDRLITLLDGGGFSLNFADGIKYDLNKAHTPYLFDGGSSVNCQLFGGASKDLNLMVCRNRMKFDWAIHEISTCKALALDTGATHLLFALDGAMRLQEKNNITQKLTKWGCAKYMDDELIGLSISPEKKSTLIHIQISMQ